MAVLEADVNGLVAITMVRGDSKSFLFTVTDEDGAAIDLSQAVGGTDDRPAVLRFAVKNDPAIQDNDDALVFKASHFEDQVSVLAQTGDTKGQARVFLDKPDTDEGDADASYLWDLEVTRQDALRTDDGTVEYTPDSNTVMGTGTAFTAAKKGDVLQPLGLLNTLPVLVTKVVSDTELEVDFSGWAAESGVTFELRRGDSKTVIRGPFTLELGVVSE